jgi:hypothetical protein
MTVFMVVAGFLTAWVALAVMVALALGQAARLGDQATEHAKQMEAAEQAHRFELRLIVDAAKAEREGLLRHLLAASDGAATRNLAILERATKADPDADFRAMMTAQARMNIHDEHGHIPVGLDN